MTPAPITAAWETFPVTCEVPVGDGTRRAASLAKYRPTRFRLTREEAVLPRAWRSSSNARALDARAVLRRRRTASCSAGVVPASPSR